MPHSGEYDMQEIVVRTSGGTYHRAIHNLVSDAVLTPEGCNLDDAERLETYPAMPDEAQGIDLCQRCYPVGTDR